MLPSYIPLGKYFTELTILSFVISQNHELSLFKTKKKTAIKSVDFKNHGKNVFCVFHLNPSIKCC